MAQVALQSIPASALPMADWQSVNLERGQAQDAMQVRHPSLTGRWLRNVANAPQSLSYVLRPAPQTPAGQPIVHLVGEGKTFTKILGIGLALAGFCLGYGFSTMAGEQLLLPLPVTPFNPDGMSNRRRGTALVGFNLPIGIAGILAGGLVGVGLGALVDACFE